MREYFASHGVVSGFAAEMDESAMPRRQLDHVSRVPREGGVRRRESDARRYEDQAGASPPASERAAPVKDTWPTTHEAMTLRRKSKSQLSDDVKARLIREIIEYEGSHGRCTQTFARR